MKNCFEKQKYSSRLKTLVFLHLLPEDLMLDGGGSLADIGTICEKLETELQLNEFVGYDLQFQFSMFYFHLAVKDIAGKSD